jgi:hypothetical protein
MNTFQKLIVVTLIVACGITVDGMAMATSIRSRPRQVEMPVVTHAASHNHQPAQQIIMSMAMPTSIRSRPLQVEMPVVTHAVTAPHRQRTACCSLRSALTTLAFAAAAVIAKTMYSPTQPYGLDVDRASFSLPDNPDCGAVKHAYRDLARQWHPDRNPNSVEEATEKFKVIISTYERLQQAYCSGRK